MAARELQESLKGLHPVSASTRPPTEFCDALQNGFGLLADAVPSRKATNNEFRTTSNRAVAADLTKPGRVYAAEAIRVINTSGKVIDGADRGDAGQSPDPLGERNEESRPCLRRGLLGAIERHADGKQPVWHQADIDVLEMGDRPRKQDRRGGQHECERDLGADKERARTAACATAGHRAARYPDRFE